MPSAVEKPDTTVGFSKVPEVTIVFWIIKIFCTTLGETGGDAVTMSMNLGYLVGTAIFAAIFIVAVAAQVKASGFIRFCTAHGGLNLSRYSASAALIVLIIACIVIFPQRPAEGTGH